MPMTAAWALARMASAPRVGPPVRCSTVSTGTGRGPAVDEQGQFLGLFHAEGAGDPSRSAGDAGTAVHGGIDLGRGDDLVVQDDADAARGITGRGAGRRAGQPGPAVRARVLEVDADEPADEALPAGPGFGAVDVRSGQLGRTEAQGLSFFVGQDLFLRALGKRLGRLLAGLGGAEHRVEGELGGAAEDVGGFLRVLDTGQFDDDPVVAGTGDGGLRDAERVDAAAQYLHGAVGGRRVGLDGGGVAGFQHDLGAAAQVEAEAGRNGCGDVERQGYNSEGEKRPYTHGARQECLQQAYRSRHGRCGRRQGGMSGACGRRRRPPGVTRGVLRRCRLRHGLQRCARLGPRRHGARGEGCAAGRRSVPLARGVPAYPCRRAAEDGGARIVGVRAAAVRGRSRPRGRCAL